MKGRALRFALAALGVASLAGALIYAVREPLMLAALAARGEKTSLAARIALLEPAMEVYAPEGATRPLPAVLQFHGCAGRSIEHERQFAAIANAAGYVAFSFDSNGPRGIDRATALETVCRGTALIGQERAGDIAAALEIVRRRSDVDPGRLVLAGWSHGAWSAMDYLTFAAAGKNPPGVDGAPPSALSGVILFYPYCGPGARARFARWSTISPSLALIAGADEIVDGPQCKALFDRVAGKDKGVSISFYPDANHVFDHRELAGADRRYFSEDATRDAEARYRAFLDAAIPSR